MWPYPSPHRVAPAPGGPGGSSQRPTRVDNHPLLGLLSLLWKGGGFGQLSGEPIFISAALSSVDNYPSCGPHRCADDLPTEGLPCRQYTLSEAHIRGYSFLCEGNSPPCEREEAQPFSKEW
ncbi:hypothetical protein PV325_011438 [Microctonus aethiopoides]|nr:hypothetical protein PV325_011438 [Microctonus aethiopoides]